MAKIWSWFFRCLSSNLLVSLTLEGLVILSMDRVWAQNPNPTRPQEQPTPFILPPKVPEPALSRSLSQKLPLIFLLQPFPPLKDCLRSLAASPLFALSLKVTLLLGTRN